MGKPVDSIPAASDLQDAGAPEIEISPAMTRAGQEILGDYDPRYDSMGQTAAQIFRAMMKARPQHDPKDS